MTEQNDAALKDAFSIESVPLPDRTDYKPASDLWTDEALAFMVDPTVGGDAKRAAMMHGLDWRTLDAQLAQGALDIQGAMFNTLGAQQVEWVERLLAVYETKLLADAYGPAPMEVAHKVLEGIRGKRADSGPAIRALQSAEAGRREAAKWKLEKLRPGKYGRRPETETQKPDFVRFLESVRQQQVKIPLGPVEGETPEAAVPPPQEGSFFRDLTAAGDPTARP